MKVKHEFLSKSNPNGKPHVTTYDTDAHAVTACTCRGFRSPARCWHVTAVQEMHANGTPVAAPVSAPVPVSAPTSVEPMLASAMTKGQTLAAFGSGWVLEEKYDGVRQVITVRNGKVEASRSRAGNTRTLPTHITAALSVLPDGIYDGELLSPGGISTDVTRLDKQASLSLVVFDAVEILGQRITDRPYTERRDLLTTAVAHITKAQPEQTAVTLAAAQPVSREAVEQIWARGGEGAILKRTTSRYQPGARSADWVKVKRLGHVTVTVLGYEAGDTGDANGRTLVRTDEGREFRVKTQRSILGANLTAAVGRRVVLQYIERLASGAYRHPSIDHMAGAGE